MKTRIRFGSIWPLLLVAAPAAAQYAAPVKIPDAFATGTSDDRSIEVGLAVDGSGSPPYAAAFFGDVVTDGTLAGTRLLQNGLSVTDVAAVPNGVGAYLVATGPSNPTTDQLYYTDGTEAGTQYLSALAPAFPGGVLKIHGFVQGAVVVETRFGGLFVTKGTAAETFEVRPDIFGLTAVERVSIGATQGFAQIGESQGSHIFRFGATAGETVEITPSLPGYFQASELTAFGDRACFVAGESQVGASTYKALYCTDGSVAGTVPITQDAGGAPLGIYQGEGGLQKFGSNLYFVPIWKPYPRSVDIYQSAWSTDGTAAGTHRLAISSTASWSRIGTADGRIFFSNYSQSTGLPFVVSDGSALNTLEILRDWWEISGLFRGDRENPTLGSAVFFTSWEYATPDSYPQLRRTDGSAAGTFPLPSPVAIPASDWRPASDVKPAIVGRYLLVENAGTQGTGIWSFDLDGIFRDAFD